MTGEEALQALASATTAAVVRPGDTLIIGLAGPVDQETIASAAAAMKERLPDIEICLINQVAALAVVAKK